MNKDTVAKLMLSGVMFALIIFVLTVGIAVAVSVYLLGVHPDSSVLVGILATLAVSRGLVEVVDASI